jgi:hypothetical protein
MQANPPQNPADTRKVSRIRYTIFSLHLWNSCFQLSVLYTWLVLVARPLG